MELLALKSKLFRKYLYKEILFKLNRWTISSFFIGFLIFLPIGLVILHIGSFTENWRHITDTVLITYSINSIVLVLATVLFSCVFGISSAWVVTNYKFPGHKIFRWALVLPLAIPTYIAAYAYFDILDLFNPFLIWLRSSFGLNTMQLANDMLVYLMTALIMASVLYPYVYLLARASFESQGGHFINVGRSLGHSGKSIFWKVVLPLSRPAIVAGISLVAMETLSDYGAVKHFGIQTFTYGIFRTWLGMGDLTSALRLAVILLGFTLSILYLEKKIRSEARYGDKSTKSLSYKRNYLKGKKYIFALTVCILPFTFGFIIPVSRMLYWAWLSKNYLNDLNTFQLTFNTLTIALLTSISTVVLSILLGFSSKYFKSSIVQSSNRFASLGYSTPGAVIAMGALILVGYVSSAFNIIISGTMLLLIFAYIVRFLAVAYQPIISGFEKNCDELNDASKTLGVSPVYSLVKINLPLIKNTLIAAGLLVFIDATKELPLTLILRPFNYETLATATFDLSNQAQIIESSIPSLFIIFLTVIPIIYLNQRIGEGR